VLNPPWKEKIDEFLSILRVGRPYLYFILFILRSVNDDLKAGKGLEHDISKARIIVSRQILNLKTSDPQSSLKSYHL